MRNDAYMPMQNMNIPTMSMPAMNVPPMGMPTMNAPPMGMPAMNVPPMGMPTMNVPPMGMPAMNVPPMNMPTQYSPMAEMSQENIENMYPKIYHIVNPACDIACENLHMKKGEMHTPTQEELDMMVESVYNKVESEVEAEIAKDENKNNRQLGFGGRRLLRNLIGILLIRRLLRRRPFQPGFGSPFGGFGPGFGAGYGFFGRYPY